MQSFAPNAVRPPVPGAAPLSVLTPEWSDYERDHFHPQIRYIAEASMNLPNICLIKSHYRPEVKLCTNGTSIRIKMTTTRTRRVEPIPNNFYKVLVSIFISGSRHSLYHRQKLIKKVFTSGSNEWYSDNFIAFKVSTSGEMKSLYSYLTSWIVSDLFALAKTTRNVSSDSFIYVPLVPFDRIWDSREVIKWISLTVEKPRRWLRELPTGIEWSGLGKSPRE
jgi:hypothetical protein